MNSGANATPHLDDGDLIRLLDSELDDRRAVRVEAHARSCDRCGRRLDALAARSVAASSLLRRTAAALPPPPSRSREAVMAAYRAGGAAVPIRPARTRRAGPGPATRRHLLRAAAVAALLLGVGIGVPPVRAWVGERIAAWTGVFRTDPAPAILEAATVSFVPSTRDLVIRFDAPGGAARFTVGASDRLTADATGPEAPGVRLLVMNDGVRVPGGSDGVDYRFTLPAGTRSVRVQLDGRVISERRLEGPGQEWVVPIALP